MVEAVAIGSFARSQLCRSLPKASSLERHAIEREAAKLAALLAGVGQAAPASATGAPA